MAITSHLTADGSTLNIVIDGRFDFSAHQAFRAAYEGLPERPEHYCIDLEGTTYLDSSALGMLLLLRDHAGGDRADIEIVNCTDDVRKVLTISNFDQLFQIRPH